MFFKGHKLLVDVFDPPFVGIPQNAAPVRGEAGAVDHGQVHVLGTIADALFHHESSLINSKGQHDVNDFLLRHLLWGYVVVFEIFLDSIGHFRIGNRLTAAVIKISGTGFAPVAPCLIDDLGERVNFVALAQSLFKGFVDVVIDVDAGKIGQSGRPHGHAEFHHGRFYNRAGHSVGRKKGRTSE